jgi:hypothetical protein
VENDDDNHDDHQASPCPDSKGAFEHSSSLLLLGWLGWSYPESGGTSTLACEVLSCAVS